MTSFAVKFLCHFPVIIKPTTLPLHQCSSLNTRRVKCSVIKIHSILCKQGHRYTDVLLFPSINSVHIRAFHKTSSSTQHKYKCSHKYGRPQRCLMLTIHLMTFKSHEQISWSRNQIMMVLMELLSTLLISVVQYCDPKTQCGPFQGSLFLVLALWSNETCLIWM